MLERKSGSPLVSPSSSDANMVNAGSDELSHDDAKYFLYPKPPAVGRRRTSMTGKTSPGFSEQFDGLDPHGLRRRILARRGSAPEVTIGLPPIEDKFRKMNVLSKSSSKLSLEKLNTSLADANSSSMNYVSRNGGVNFANRDKDDSFDENATLLRTRDYGSWAKKQVAKEKSHADQCLNNSDPKVNLLRPYNRRRRLSSSPTNLRRIADELNNDVAVLPSKKYSNKYRKESLSDINMNICLKDKSKGNKSVSVVEEDDDSIDEEFNQRILTWIDDVQKATKNPFLSDDEDDDVSRETAIRIIHNGD